MPRFDGTGPRGQGPMTGRGLGPCGAGKGYGRGYGMGYGRGYGWGCPFCGALPQVITEKEEKEMLKNEAEILEEELKAIKERLSRK